MPFTHQLSEKQTTKFLSFKSDTDSAKRLQEAFNLGNSTNYEKILHEEQKDGSKFSLTDMKIYEIFDNNEEKQVPIVFQVKGSVITWYFIAEKDQTTQEFRDSLYVTAAKAHAAVDNGCESYYRGSNHYHLKKMHTHPPEAGLNHNHYRIKEATPNDSKKNTAITPLEVYQHLKAFYAQEEGRQFIPDEYEIDLIIFNFAEYWAAYEQDINYAIFDVLSVHGSSLAEDDIDNKIKAYVESVISPEITPEMVEAEIEQFSNSEHGYNMLTVLQNSLEQWKNIVYSREEIKLKMTRIVEEYATQYEEKYPMGVDFSAFSDEDENKKSSPRDEYFESKKQKMDEVDNREINTFAKALTGQCRNIDNHYLGQLSPELFRRALNLYFELITIEDDIDNYIVSYCSKLNLAIPKKELEDMLSIFKEAGHTTTEEELGHELLNQLSNWVKNPPNGLKTWITYISENGSRGLGSEIAHYREANGDINPLQQQQDDREGMTLNFIDLKKTDLNQVLLGLTPNESELFNKLYRYKKELSNNEVKEQGKIDACDNLMNIMKKGASARKKPKDKVSQANNFNSIEGVESKEYFLHEFNEILKKLSHNPQQNQGKISVCLEAMNVVKGFSTIDDLHQCMKDNPGFDTTAFNLKSKLSELIIELKESRKEVNSTLSI